MNYEETLQYLYRQLPVFQQVGQSAYKPGLGNSLALDRLVGYPAAMPPYISPGPTEKARPVMFWLPSCKRAVTKWVSTLHPIS